MARSAIESVLAIDIGELTTRVLLYEQVDGGFLAVARGEAPTTAGIPELGVMPGVLEALKVVETAAGKVFIIPQGNIQAAPNLVDAVVVTLAAGADIRTVCVSLTTDISLESVIRLACSSDTAVVASLARGDGRPLQEQMDAVLHSSPELIIIGGGTEHGKAGQAGDLLNALRMALALLPRDKRPEVLYAGSSALEEKTRHTIGTQAPVTVTANIQPQVDQESLDPARTILMGMTARLKSRRVTGMQSLVDQTGGEVTLRTTSFGRMIRYLGSVYQSARGVLGVDMGITHLTLAGARAGQLWQGRYLYPAAQQEISSDSMQQLLDWLTEPVYPEKAAECWLQRDIYPGAIPELSDEVAVDLSLARLRIQQVMQQYQQMYPVLQLSTDSGLTPGWEPIILSGEWPARWLSPAQAVHLLLDALQPTGITNLVLDSGNLLSLLGACGQVAPNLPVDLLEAGLLQHLGTVVAPVCLRAGVSRWMELSMQPEGGEEVRVTVYAGNLFNLPLDEGQSARLTLIPEPHIQLGRKLNHGELTLKVTGSALGVIIDARGRKIQLPAGALERQKLLKKWQSSLIR
jgi:hypothetical protein